MKNVLSIVFAAVMFAALVSAIDPPACAPGWEVGACGCTLDVPGTYTINASGLTSGDASTCIAITANNVVLDCQGHSITGPGSLGMAVQMASAGSTVRNCDMGSYYDSIELWGATGNNVTGNNISSSSIGILLHAATGNTVENNNATSNDDGIMLESSSTNNNFTGNTITGNNIYDFLCSDSSSNTDGGNTCDGRDSCRWVQSCGFDTFVVNKTSPACTAANGGGYFNTITGAVSAANGSNGDHIIVCNGTYDESIAIDKEVNIIGESRAGVITGTFYIHDANYTSVSNLTISLSPGDYRILDLERTDHVAVSNISVEGDLSHGSFVHGIYVDTTNNAAISDILMNNIYASSGNNAYGIYLTNASDNHFSGISGGNITSDDSPSAYGIYLNGPANNNTFNDITFEDVAGINTDAKGIVLDGANYNNFTAIQFNNITGTSATGMEIDSSDYNTIQSLTAGNLAANDGEAKFIYLWTSAEYNNVTGATCGDINASQYAFGIEISDKSHNTFSQITTGNINGTVGGYGMDIANSIDDKFFNVSVGNVSGGSSSAYGAYLVNTESDVLSNFTADSVYAGGGVAFGIYQVSSDGDNTVSGGSIGTITAAASSQAAYGIGWDHGDTDNITGMTLGHIVAPGGSGSAYGLAYWNTGNSYFTGLTFDNVTGSPPNGYAYGVYSGYGNSGNTVSSISFGKISGTGVLTSSAVYLYEAESEIISDVNATELQSTTGNVSGVLISYTTYSNISNVRIGFQDANTTTAGVLFDHATSNLVRNLTIGDITSHNDVAFGVQFESSGGKGANTVDGITTGNITSEDDNAYGAYFEDSINNTVTGASFENIVADGTPYGVYATGGSANIFANSTLPTIVGGDDVYFGGSSDQTMLNATFNESNVEYGDTFSVLVVDWYYNVYVDQMEGGGLIRGAALPEEFSANTFSWAGASGNSQASSRTQEWKQNFESKLQHNITRLGLQPEAGSQDAAQAGELDTQNNYYVQLIEKRIEALLSKKSGIMGSEPVPEAQVTVNESTHFGIDNPIFIGQTGLDGYIGWQVGEEYQMNSYSRNTYTPHAVMASKGDATSDWVIFTMNHSTLLNFSFSLSSLKVVNNSGPACETGDYYTTIAAALAAAPENGLVVVCNGTYNENVHINKSVNLIGESPDGVLIEAAESDPLVTVDPGLSVNMSGFTMLPGAVAGINASGTHDSEFTDIAIGDIGIPFYSVYGIDASNATRDLFDNITLGNITTSTGNAYGIITDGSNDSVFAEIAIDGSVIGADEATLLSADDVNGNGYMFIVQGDMSGGSRSVSAATLPRTPYDYGSVVSTDGNSYLIHSANSSSSIFLVVGTFGDVIAGQDAVAFYDADSFNNSYVDLGAVGGEYASGESAYGLYALGSDQLHFINNVAFYGPILSGSESVGLYLDNVTNSDFNRTGMEFIGSDGTSMGVLMSGTNNTINGFLLADAVSASDWAMGLIGIAEDELSSNRISNFHVAGIDAGIEAEGIGLLGGSGNRIENFSAEEIYGDSFISAGAVLLASVGNTIVNFSAGSVEAYDTSYGIVFEISPGNTVQGANFGNIASEGHASGVAILGGANNTISGFAANGISAENGMAYGAYFNGGMYATGINGLAAGSRFGSNATRLASAAGPPAYLLIGCNNNTLANSTIPEANYSAFLLSCNATMLNTTFDESSAVELNGTLNVSWYYNVHVTSGGVPADGAILGVTDTFHRTVFSGTLPSGSTGQQVGTEYTENSTFAPPPPGAAGLLLPPAGDRTYYSPYEASATLGSASGSVSFALDSSKDITLEVAGGPYVPEENGGSSYGWTPTPTPYNPTPAPTNTPEVSPIPSGTPSISPTPAANATETPTPSITPTPPPVITPTPVPTQTPAWITPEPTTTPPAPCMGFALLLFGAAGIFLALKRK